MKVDLMNIPGADKTLAAQLPESFANVAYQGARFPGAPGVSEIEAGGNCQLYAYAVLEHFGLRVPPLRSSELWTDDRFEHVADDGRALDLVMYGPDLDPVGAHIGVIIGENAVLHLCAELGRPAIWSADDFGARERYACRIAVRRYQAGVSPSAPSSATATLSLRASELDLLIRERRVHAERPFIVAVDGRSGVGKTTFAEELAHRQGGQAITADDFWPGGEDDHWEALSPAERAGRGMDWRRLRAQVLEPLVAGRRVSWQGFDWEAGKGLSDHRMSCEPKPVIVLDGAYSSRPELADLIDLAVLLTLNDDTRRSRLLEREGEEFMRRWHARWDMTEDHYFATVRPPDSFDAVLSMDPVKIVLSSDGEDAATRPPPPPLGESN